MDVRNRVFRNYQLGLGQVLVLLVLAGQVCSQRAREPIPPRTTTAGPSTPSLPIETTAFPRPPGPIGPPGPSGPRRPKPTRTPPSTTPLPTFSIPPPTEYKLINANDEPGMGRVLGMHNGTWHQVCTREGWRQNDATVLCRSLGFERGFNVPAYWFPALVEPTLPPPPPADGDERKPMLLPPRPTEKPMPKLQLNFKCQGTEASLEECPGTNEKYCYNDAATICVGPTVSGQGIEKVRSLQAPDRPNATDFSAMGRFEVYHRGQWGLVCDSFNKFGPNEVKAFCTQLGYKNGYKMASGLFYYRSPTTHIYWLKHLNCARNVDNINECLDGTYPGEGKGNPSCGSYNTVSGYCYDSTKTYPLSPRDIQEVRLTNQTTAKDKTWTMGRLEVKIDGTWGTACQALRYSRAVWTDTQANVACRMLNYAGGIAVKSSVFGPDDSHIWLSQIKCQGTEDNFGQCTSALQAPSDCALGGAGVFCVDASVDIDKIMNQTVRIVGSPDKHTNKTKAGRVEYFYKGLWGPVCQDGWDIREAYIVCKELGFKDGYPMCNSSFGDGSGPNWLNQLGCAGNEKDLKDCLGWRATFLEHGLCGKDQQAGLQCVDDEPEGPVSLRLVDKNSKAKEVVSGVVEVLYKGHWGTICSKNWDDSDARVVCRQLGYVTGAARTNLTIGIGTTMVWLNDVNCQGHEKQITDCMHEGWAINQCAPACEHTSDAGVICTGKIKETKDDDKKDDDKRNDLGKYNLQSSTSDDKGSASTLTAISHIFYILAAIQILLYTRQQ